ncbi:MAG TPA: NAD(P)H-dependent glycerol-3-phosphate dehydrogenase [Planctomycetota bacterium]
MKNVIILGDGAWGTALALVLQRGGHRVGLWTKFPENAAEMRAKGENAKFLPGVPLKGVDILSGAPPAADVYIAAVPTQFIRGAFTEIGTFLAKKALFICVAKGLEQSTGRRPTEILREVLGKARLVVLSGPSHAPEVAVGLPASVVVAGDPKNAKTAQELFAGTTVRVYTSRDVKGVELGGALKNVIALAGGICDGLGLGHNAKAALLTRGIVEMARLGAALGAKTETFFGLSGIGDLITTTTFPHGRNLSVGRAIGEGKPLEEILGGMRSVAEGVWSAKAVLDVAKKKGVDMPITQQVYAILFEKKSAKEALRDLMRRDMKSER